MTAFSVADAAARLIEARRTRRPIALPEAGPTSTDEAFAVQDAVAASLGPAAAWKVGRGGTAAPIAASLVRPSPCIWPAAELLRIGIEAEIAFRIGRDLGFGPTPPGEDEIRSAIASIHPAVEIVDSRFDIWPVPDRFWALADNQSNGGFVYGPDGNVWDGSPLGSADATVTVDGEPIFSERGTNPGGEPFPLLVWLVGHLAGRGSGLPAGSFVTTGSLCGILWVEPGAEVVANVGDVGRVELRLPR
ncbi:2-keto-4-pentenoate hydratase [uncultured Enterovirga sp.]|uniref:2-keto-4-pentenoate hydratase n=1 Tax=uncultured Enterovirga sp. TaxID=2026352 RepID=UPI0035C94671